MIRPGLHLYPAAEPSPPRPAVTLMLLREAAHGPHGFEILLSRRSHTARFVPGAYVFPGGAIDPQDHTCTHLADRRADQDAQATALAIAAVRESLEELGILLARRADGQPVRSADIQSHLNRQQPLAPQMQALGWRFALEHIYRFGHWITDRDYPRRFDVPFLLAPMPAHQQAQADNIEQFDPLWLSPVHALERHRDGALPLVYPTVRTLEKLAEFASVQAVLHACRHGTVMPTSSPRAAYVHGREVRFMEHEAPFAELELVCPQGQLQHDVGWQHEKPVPLLKHLHRLTAPNAGVMTGPGTNTYLIGQPETGFIAIDPGSWGTDADAQHLQRLMQATGGDIRHILCTHSHPDHSPAAAPLQALVEAAGYARPPIWGMPSAANARADSHFQPDRTLHHGDCVGLHTADDHPAPIHHTLQAIHTPGHVSNHLCFLLQEDALLFCGDHILGGTTTVILPPDGNMNDYLQSLDRLQTLCATHGVQYLLPAHGHVLHQPETVIQQLRAHRLRREEKVWQAIRQQPNGSLHDWLAQAYADTPEKMWPVARFSLQAHAERLALLHPEFAPSIHAALQAASQASGTPAAH